MSKSGQMDPFTKDTGKMVRQMDVEDSCTKRATSTKVSGRTIKLMVLAITSIRMARSTEDSGSKIPSMVEVWKNGQMVLSLRETTMRG